MKWPLTLLRLWPTMRCTRACWYCANWAHGAHIERTELSADAWAAFIAGVEGVSHVILSGGEPVLHPGFTRIVQACAEKGLITGVYSNCSDEMAEAARSLQPRPSLYFDFSYHLPTADRSEDVVAYAERFNRVRAAGHTKLTAYTIIFHDNLARAYRDAAAFFRLTGYRMGFKPMDGYVGGTWHSDHAEREEVFGPEGNANCYRGDLVVDPTGTIYRCHHFMFTEDKRGVVGSIAGGAPSLEPYDCAAAHRCSTCDVGNRRLI